MVSPIEETDRLNLLKDLKSLNELKKQIELKYDGLRPNPDELNKEQHELFILIKDLIKLYEDGYEEYQWCSTKIESDEHYLEGLSESIVNSIKSYLSRRKGSKC